MGHDRIIPEEGVAGSATAKQAEAKVTEMIGPPVYVNLDDLVELGETDHNGVGTQPRKDRAVGSAPLAGTAKQVEGKAAAKLEIEAEPVEAVAEAAADVAASTSTKVTATPSGSANPAPAEQGTLPLSTKGGALLAKWRSVEAALAWLASGRLTHADVALVIIIAADYSRELGACRRTRKYLAQRNAQSIRSVSRSLDRVEEVGLIRRRARWSLDWHRQLATDIVLINPPPVPQSGVTRVSPPGATGGTPTSQQAECQTATKRGDTGGTVFLPSSSLPVEKKEPGATGGTPTSQVEKQKTMSPEDRATPEQWAELKRVMAEMKNARQGN